MVNNYISCKEYTQLRKQELKEEISKLHKNPRLVVIQVGDNQASNSYIRGKEKDCNEVGIDFQLVKLPIDISEEELLNRIKYFNSDNRTNGIIVQLPLPKHINVDSVKNFINPNKDVDGFHKNSHFKPCTPKGIIDWLEYNKVDLIGKDVVVLGRSEIVGKPLVNMLIDKGATVTCCNSNSINIGFYTDTADIVISAVGKLKYFGWEYFSSDVEIIIDVGINRDRDNKLCGDIDTTYFDTYCPYTYVTPVPNGVGLLTRLSLLENTYQAYLNQKL